jgi:hypothetical protein
MTEDRIRKTLLPLGQFQAFKSAIESDGKANDVLADTLDKSKSLIAETGFKKMTDDHTRKIKLDTLREVQKVLAFAMSDTSTLARAASMNAISKMIEELK